ncbi:MAG: hypothetical protein ACLRPR_10655, partial [Eisenbergiella sp.]
ELFSKLSCFSIAATVIDFTRTVRFCQALFSSFLKKFFCSASPAVRCILSSHARFCQYLFLLFFYKVFTLQYSTVGTGAKKKKPKEQDSLFTGRANGERGI